MLLTAVITGSLMTGKSVRKSLQNTSFEKLGNTGIVISSGLRFIDPSLPARLTDRTGIESTGITEIDGFCQNFSSQKIAHDVKIFAVENNFFDFHGKDTLRINPGEVALNERLAEYLDIKPGDDVIIKFNPLTDIPADAPFSPGKNPSESVVMKVGRILDKTEPGNFSLNINQAIPLNIFINRSDLHDSKGNIPKINRILFKRQQGITVSEIYENLKSALTPGDIGLTVRFVPAVKSCEIISDRIFIDQALYDEILKSSLECHPVITYLANSISIGSQKSTPYSFVSAVDTGLAGMVPDGNHILINSWLADDLGAAVNDTLKLTWYSPDPLNRLAELQADFIVSGIADMVGIFGDSLLMPEFPGIAGSKSCTDWDAGVEIKMDLIRKKDEDYWNRYKGTPKAFINYVKGNELWASNFGPVTSIRFGSDLSEKDIISKLTGTFDPYKTGFTISDLPHDSVNAANKGVDFSTLFLSLGFFIIVSALVLIVLLVSSFFESKKDQIKTFFSIGFPNREIEKLLLTETGLVEVAGAIIGTLAGALFNILLIKALNTVWQGAVQTNALSPDFDTGSVITGFLVTIAVIFTIIKIKSSAFLKKLNQPETGETRRPSVKKNFILLVSVFFMTAVFAVLSFLPGNNKTVFSFVTGLLLFILFIISLRQYNIADIRQGFRKLGMISRSYYSNHPSQFISPVLFLAAGLFAVIITGVNRMNITGNMLRPSGGTGGFLLWGETSLPVLKDINSPEGRKDYGLDGEEFRELKIIQAKRTSGNDASCLNLNHITSPPILGIDPSEFIERGSFSFAVAMKEFRRENPWKTLDYTPDDFTIYGIADQTVMQYGLKIKTGDTLKIRSENGQVINVIISAGLKSSIFQGYVIIGSKNFIRFFPSAAGSQVFLADGRAELSEKYTEVLEERLSEFGADFMPAAERLASFFVVTNTYLSVFTILGSIGMILGVAGLGFVLIRSFHQRKRDFGLMMAAGFSNDRIRKLLTGEHLAILLAGVITGVVSALFATFPSITNDKDIPWITIAVMILILIVTGVTVIWLSVKAISQESLITSIRRE